MTATRALKDVLDAANLNDLSAALAQVQLGTMLAPTQSTIVPTTKSATIPLDPPALIVQSVRVASNGGTGTAYEGVRVVGDAGATPVAGSAADKPGTCAVAADGTSVLLEGTVDTDGSVVVVYIPRSYTDLDTSYTTGV